MLKKLFPDENITTLRSRCRYPGELIWIKLSGYQKKTTAFIIWAGYLKTFVTLWIYSVRLFCNLIEYHYIGCFSLFSTMKEWLHWQGLITRVISPGILRWLQKLQQCETKIERRIYIYGSACSKYTFFNMCKFNRFILLD